MTANAIAALEALVEALEAEPLFESYEHCAWFWQNEARLNRIARQARGVEDATS